MNNGPPLSEHSAGAIASDNSAQNPANTSHTTVTPINDESAFQSATSSLPPSALLVLYFHAPWAEPCKQMSTVLSTLASTYPSTPDLAFLAIDAEEVSDVSEHYDVTQVPYIVLQKNGQVLETISGGDAAGVRQAVEKHAGAPQGNPGKFGLPPAQKVTKPLGTEPVGAEHQQGQGQQNGTKNLSGYAPGGGDAQTAPQYSSGENNEASKEELNGRLGELVKAAPVMLFMKGTPSAPQCGFSRQTVSLLRDRGIRYGFFNILADDEVRQGLKEFSDWPTFPQVYVGGELVGGLDIVSFLPLFTMPAWVEFIC